MVSSRAATALAGVAVSLVASAIAWYYFQTLLLFLLVPFVPILLRGRGGTNGGRSATRYCPTCAFSTHDPDFEYCPLDGSKLTARE